MLHESLHRRMSLWFSTRLYSLLLAVLFINLSFCLAIQQDKTYEPKTVIVKFQESSIIYKQLQSNSSGQINELVSLLGSHNVQTLLLPSTLRCVEQSAQKLLNEALKPTTLGNNNTMTIEQAQQQIERASAVRRIYIITYSSAIDPVFLSKKLTTFGQVEYAEPLYKRDFFSIPNDSLYARQYYMAVTKANLAHDAMPADVTKVVVGIVDTGIDYNHVDLSENIAINDGEIGMDSQGRDKRTNGTDDDNNGFIDDYRGWDFGGSGTGTDPDNDPMPAIDHGTHVAGIVGARTNNTKGIASIGGNFVRLLPIKVAGDDANSRGIIRGYDGVAYAGAMRAGVMNLSWGGPNESVAEQEIITLARGFGTVIVAAAGNDNSSNNFFPCSYKGVVSVAAVGSNDRKASFSNYNFNVDINSPGNAILSTIPNNQYMNMDGTSMASPVIAGTCALIKARFPNFTPDQIEAQLKATSDNTESRHRNTLWAGKMGAGRVNVLNAINNTQAKFAEISNISYRTQTGDSIIVANSEMRIFPTVHNMLSVLTNVRAVVTITSASPTALIIDTTIIIGRMEVGDTRTVTTPLKLKIPETLYEPNLAVSGLITLFDDTLEVGRTTFSTIINPTYRTLQSGNITVTINSTGNIGFNDFPTNKQGVGFLYKQQPNILFEAGLMVSARNGRLSDVVRRETSGIAQNSAFSFLQPLTFLPTLQNVSQNVEAVFADSKFPDEAGVQVRHRTVMLSGEENSNFVLLEYTIKNITSSLLDSVHCGVYADWDVGANGRDNQAIYDTVRKHYYVYSTSNPNYPFVGSALLSTQSINAYMIDNDATIESIGVYDGYTNQEKVTTISSGIMRSISSIGDVSATIAGGPIALNPSDSATFVFSIFVGDDLASMRVAADNARKAYDKTTDIQTTSTNDNSFMAMNIQPMPLSDISTATVSLSLPLTGVYTVEIVDMHGLVRHTLASSWYEQGSHTLSLADISKTGTTELEQGVYFLRVTGMGQTASKSLMYIR